MNNKFTTSYLCTLFCLVFTNSLLSQNEQLDLTFGQGGKVMTAINVLGDSYINGAAIQSDGKIVAAGGSDYGSSYDFTIVRYNTDGTLDNTFGMNGIVTTGIGVTDDVANSVAVQNDGKIIAVGYIIVGNSSDFALARYNTNGTLDSTFGSNGTVITPIGFSTDFAYSTKIQNDGKIVAAGYTYNGNDNDFALVRYNTDGTLDNTFGTNGIVTTQVTIDIDYAYSVALQSDGKIVAAGSSTQSGYTNYTLVRYNTNGSIDNTFGSNGILISSLSSTFDEAYSVSIQTDGKIMATGYANNGIDNDFAVARYNTNGTFDNTFSGDGIVTTPIGAGNNMAFSTSIQVDGKIIAAGYSDSGANFDFALARYNSNGDLDNTFGTNGIVITQIDSSIELSTSTLIQSDGKIIAAGYSFIGTYNDLAVVRYNADGILDKTFGFNGIVTTSVGTADNEAYSVAIQSDGKIVVAGTTNNGTNDDFALVRYNSNGKLDYLFGINGIVTTPIGTGHDRARSVVVQNDGKIIVTGFTRMNNNYDFALVRYNSDETVDDTFGTNGIVTTTIGADNDEAFSVAIQIDGKIIAAGFSWDANYNEEFALVRYNTNGTLDNAFGTNGIVITDILATSNAVFSIAIQSDGKIVAAGYYDNEFNDDIALARYNQDGSLDNSFGAEGIVTTQIGTAGDWAYSVAIQSDGKIIAAGESYNGSNSDFALARYNPNGTLDNTFGISGKLVTQIGAYGEYANSVAVQNEGKIVAAGFYDGRITPDFALTRYNQDGSLDNTFGTNGIIITEIGTFEDYANSVAIQDDGKIVVAGYSNNANNYSVFTLVRYNEESSSGLIEENTEEIPNTYALEQNYPNPFNPNTSILFSIPEQSFVNLEIFNSLGEKVLILVSDELNAGNYKYEWNAATLSSGIYLYRLRTPQHSETKKMILLR